MRQQSLLFKKSRRKINMASNNTKETFTLKEIIALAGLSEIL